MKFNKQVTIEELLHLRCRVEADSAYSEYSHFIVSWADSSILCITSSHQMPNAIETGTMLGLLWEHQMYSLEDWCHIQIALNRSGCICFLYRIQDGHEREADRLVKTIKIIEAALQLQIRKNRYP